MVHRKIGAEFKARVALEAIKEEKTTAEISSEYKVHATQISSWKRRGLSGIKESFINSDRGRGQEEELREQLYAQIGQLKVENDFLKKTVYPH